MYCWAFITTILFVAASGQDEKKFVFIKHEASLSNCIENFILNIDRSYEKENLARVVSVLAAKKFVKKSSTSKQIDVGVDYLFWDIRHRQSNLFSDEQLLTVQLKSLIKKALQECSEKICDSHTTNAPVSEPARNVPRIKDTVNQNNEWFRFSQDKALLVQCIKNHFLNDPSWIDNAENAEIIADIVASKFFGKSITRKNLHSGIKRLLNKLQSGQIPHPLSIQQIFSKQFFEAIKNALKNCAYDKSSNNMTDAPIFEGEPPEISNILKYILVDWVFHPFHMVQTRQGRVILRRYANDAFRLLEYAFNIYEDFDLFRLSLRVFWMRRAQEFYDANSPKFPFVLYRYTVDDPRPHTIINSNIFYKRVSQNFGNRNPPANKSLIDIILNTHSADRPSEAGEFDIFADYEINGMSSAEYYLESHIDQFYRILFFFLELRSRNIVSDEDDKFDGRLPSNVLVEFVQDILYDDNIYRNYLSWRRYHDVTAGNPQNRIIQNLARTARVREEDLIMLFFMNTSSTSDTRSSISTTTSTTTTVKSTSTTKQSYEKSKKGSVFVNSSGKHFYREPKATFSNNDESDQCPQKKPRMDDKYYGYVMCNDEHLHLENKSSLFAIILSDSFKLFGDQKLK